MIIHPSIIVTPDRPTIRFRTDFALVRLDKELPKILHNQGWGCGTYFNVQFTDHKQTQLLASALFIVSEESEAIVVNDDNPDQTVSKTVFTRKAERISDWWHVETPVSTEGLHIKWNCGAQKHQVFNDAGEMFYQSQHKSKAQMVVDGVDPETILAD